MLCPKICVCENVFAFWSFIYTVSHGGHFLSPDLSIISHFPFAFGNYFAGHNNWVEI